MPDIIWGEMLVSKTSSVLGAGLALACALLLAGCSDWAGKPSAMVQKKAPEEHKPAAPFNLDPAVGQSAHTFTLKD